MPNDNTTPLSDEARQKMIELLSCGNERVELAAAKEIVSLFDKKTENNNDIKLEVTIKIVE